MGCRRQSQGGHVAVAVSAMPARTSCGCSATGHPWSWEVPAMMSAADDGTACAPSSACANMRPRSRSSASSFFEAGWCGSRQRRTVCGGCVASCRAQRSTSPSRTRSGGSVRNSNGMGSVRTGSSSRPSTRFGLLRQLSEAAGLAAAAHHVAQRRAGRRPRHGRARGTPNAVAGQALLLPHGMHLRGLGQALHVVRLQLAWQRESAHLHRDGQRLSNTLGSASACRGQHAESGPVRPALSLPPRCSVLRWNTSEARSEPSGASACPWCSVCRRRLHYWAP